MRGKKRSKKEGKQVSSRALRQGEGVRSSDRKRERSELKNGIVNSVGKRRKKKK